MAQSKTRKKATPAARTAVSEKRPRLLGNARDGFTLRDYLVLNLIFSGFCILQLILVRMLLRDFAGLYFFFIFLMVSFLIVSLFDYFANRLGIGDQIEDSSEPVNE